MAVAANDGIIANVFGAVRTVHRVRSIREARRGAISIVPLAIGVYNYSLTSWATELPLRKLRVVLALTAVSLCAPAEAARRVALVVGIGNYEHAPRLANPRNDARDVASLLREADFEVVTSIDGDRNQLAAAIRRFSASVTGADVALFYFAGHGLQIGERNFLVPRDADIEQPYDVPLQTIELGSVITPMETGARVSLVFLDACRENPFSGALKLQGRSIGGAGGLAKLDAGVGTLIAFATGPGQFSADGSGRNSPFTAALLRVARTPGLEIQQIMKRVRAEVVAKTNGQQVPWENSSLVGDVYLLPLPIAPQGEGSEAARMPPRVPPPPCASGLARRGDDCIAIEAPPSAVAPAVAPAPAPKPKVSQQPQKPRKLKCVVENGQRFCS
jgi:hypothetical protein